MVGGVVGMSTQSKADMPAITTSEVGGASSAASPGWVIVDVSGAVVKPGLYQLPQGARVGQAIEAAGGLAADADGVYVAREINRASLVHDGVKIYIPWIATGGEAAPSVAQLISINQALASELETLWGVGPARAKAIIDNRPYGSIDELVTRVGLPQSILDKNSGKIGL